MGKRPLGSQPSKGSSERPRVDQKEIVPLFSHLFIYVFILACGSNSRNVTSPVTKPDPQIPEDSLWGGGFLEHTGDNQAAQRLPATCCPCAQQTTALEAPRGPGDH
jgi:hypothetical protein